MKALKNSLEFYFKRSAARTVVRSINPIKSIKIMLNNIEYSQLHRSLISPHSLTNHLGVTLG